MILRSVHVEAFAGLNPGLDLPAFSDTLTVIHGPNQIGKSTLFRAITSALFQRHNVSGLDVERHLISSGTLVSPRVVLTFSIGSETYRITKHFGRRPLARLEQKQGELFALIAEGMPADDRLRELLQSDFAGRGLTRSEHWGMGEILMVDQGQVRLGDSLGERTQQDVRSLLGQVGTPETTHRLLRQVKARYEEIFTPLGRVRRAGAAPPMTRLREELSALEDERREVAESIRTAEEIEARVQAEAAQDAELEEQERACREQLQRVQRDAQAEWEAELTAALAAVQSAEQALAQSESEQPALEAEAREVAAARRVSEVAEQIIEREQRLERFAELSGQISRWRERLDERPRPDAAEWLRLQRAFDELRDLERQLEARRLRLTVIREGDSPVEVQGEALDLPLGAERELALPEPARIRVPGVVRVEIRGPTAADPARHASERAGLQREIDLQSAPFRTSERARLAELAAERQDLERQLALAQARRAEVLQDEDSAAERRRVDDLRAERTTLLAQQPRWGGRIPGAEERQALEESYQRHHRQHAAQLHERRERLQQAQGRRESAGAQREARLQEAEAALARVQERRQAQRDQRVRDEADLERLREQGLWHRLAVASERAEGVEQELARAELEAQAIEKLHLALRVEQQRSREALTQPLEERVTALLREALGSSGRPLFGERLLPERMVLADSRELHLDQLSAGEHDLLALLTRLALGQLYGSDGSRHAFVLDDPLVNTDRERRGRLLDILLRATEQLQIVLFTCHPEHYERAAGSGTTWLAMSDLLLRETSGAAPER